ncbi:MAG: hypothetical protein E7478_05160 [Ruminococcaceae bacterium]|nr:hypothetical protein [Oscillospiraceae bacterium]
MIEKAIEKLNTEYTVSEKGFDRYGKVVGAPVRDALISFCRQNAEFAQAVVETSATFADCIKAIMHKAGVALSDMETYRRAADFYFKGAKISFTMTIDLGDNGFSNEQTVQKSAAKKIDLSLDDLLGF